MEEEDQQENIIMIRGFPVSFPKGRKPFAPQLALMSKLLMGVQRRENCLLESPTGTGKTLALLSAALAWQRQQKEQGLATESECQVEEDKAHTVHTGPHEPLQSFDDFRYDPTAEAPVELAYEDDHVVPSKDTPPLEKKANRASFYGDDDDDDDDVFETPKKKRQKSRKTRACSPDVHGIGERGSKGSAADADADAATASADSLASHRLAGAERDSDEEQMDSPGSHALGGTDASPGARSKPSAKTAPPRTKPSKQGKAAAAPKAAPKTPKTRGRVPRVYFCSRTHSQLNQVVAELRTCRAAFRDTSAVGIGEDGKPFSMALLASRKSTCINKEACSDPKGVDDACKRLLKDKACSYYRRAKWGQTRLPPVWDVEEAVVLGRKNQACPYYTARDSMTTADLVLCPYNYLVDPGVREIMGINLKDAVVIFDEAHNLEDSAREAASAKLSLRALSNAAGEMFRLGTKSSSLAPSYDLLRGVIIGVQAFLEEEDMGLNLGSYEKAHKVFKGTEALGLMQSRAGVTVETLISLKEALKLVVNENANDDPSSADQDEDVGSGGGRGGDVLSSGAVHVTASLVKVLGFLLAEGMENVDHYKMVVLRERGPWEPAASRGRRGRNRGGASSIATMETYLCFWCQSASVCFSEIDKQVHSVILTSGTLSPLDSFAGELGIDFPHRLEAPHVINVRKQCLVTSIGYFGGVSLDARYTNQHDLKFQDALGNALLQHARVVPGGILVFFPSYGLMDKMHERWAVCMAVYATQQVTGLLQALDAVKGVHLEPRGQGKIESVLAEYYEDIKAARELGENRPPSNSRTGALMLAVARGKVSEGIDFSDDACRMCVVIGIPYPSSKDLQVVLKKEYQDQRKRRNPRLVGGRAWYNLQAFRAVNQAVGRCIRHRSDYGAIVLCDPRYGSSAETTASLSKWVRSSVKQCRNVENSLPQVASFFRSHQQNDEHLVPLAPVTDCCLSGAGAQAEGPGREATPDIAVQESPEPELVQQSLSQMFRRSSAECAVTPTENVASGRAASVIQGTNGRTALQLLSQGSAERTTTRRDSESPKAKELAERPDAAPRQPAGSLWCRPGGVLLSQPATGSPGDLSRRVLVRGSCHLFRASATPSSHMEQSSDSDPRHNTTTLFQVSRGWAPGEGLSEGEGRWVATDGLVYAPLFCSCSGCGSAPVGEKAVGAGLLGRDLIGRAWFFPARVQADRDGVVDETSPRELVLPAYVATRQNSHRQDRRG